MNNRGKDMLNIIEKAIDHSNKIINDLLDYSREIRLELESYDARLLVEESLLSVDIPENIRTVNSVDEQKIKVSVDKMKRVFINLTRNAIDAMPNGGTLMITSSKQDSILHITFSDTRIGTVQCFAESR
jgi:signal transduction histidine kinase